MFMMCGPSTIVYVPAIDCDAKLIVSVWLPLVQANPLTNGSMCPDGPSKLTRSAAMVKVFVSIGEEKLKLTPVTGGLTAPVGELDKTRGEVTMKTAGLTSPVAPVSPGVPLRLSSIGVPPVVRICGPIVRMYCPPPACVLKLTCNCVALSQLNPVI